MPCVRRLSNQPTVNRAIKESTSQKRILASSRDFRSISRRTDPRSLLDKRVRQKRSHSVSDLPKRPIVRQRWLPYTFFRPTGSHFLALISKHARNHALRFVCMFLHPMDSLGLCPFQDAYVTVRRSFGASRCIPRTALFPAPL